MNPNNCCHAQPKRVTSNLLRFNPTQQHFEAAFPGSQNYETQFLKSYLKLLWNKIAKITTTILQRYTVSKYILFNKN